ncbi:MAG: MFS transporter [Methylobacterium frigidaeris]
MPPQTEAPRARSPFRLYAAVLASFMAAASVPTPLYRLYQAEWGFSPAMLTAVFGIYAAGLLAALLSAGALSDHVGRKPVVLAALLLECLAVALFLAATGPGWLLAARLVQGLATGAAMSALSAGLIDADPERAPLASSLTPLIGLAAGALGSGALADAAPAPLHLPYALLLLVFGAQAASLAGVAETAPRRPGALASLVPRVRVPRSGRRTFVSILPIDVAVWALGGFTLSLIPSLVREATGSPRALAGAAVVAALTGSGALAILLARRHRADRVIAAAALLLAAGVAGTLAGVVAGSVAIMLAGTALAGTGFGAGFLGVLRMTLSDVAPADRAGLMASLLTVSYLAFSVPAMAAGVAARAYGLVPTALGYGAGTILLALASLLAVRRSPGQSP